MFGAYTRGVPRPYLTGAAVLIVVVMAVTVVLDMHLVFSEHPLSYKAFNQVNSMVSRRCPARCVSDPYVQPGMLHWSVDGLDNETRWLPFQQQHHLWEDMAPSYDLPKEDYIPHQVWDNAPEQFMAKMEQGKEYDWMRGKTVLFIDDRNNVDQMCDILKGKKGSWGGHSGGYCHLEKRDILVMNWFLYGMVDNPNGWPYGEAKPLIFEDRIPQIMIPKAAEAGFGDRKPDLVVLSSLFWDANFLSQEMNKMNRTRGDSRGALWSEVAWHRGRVRKLIGTVRELFGQDIPLMFRTRQLRKQTGHNQMLYIFQLDQGCRALAKELGVRLFTWGGKLEGYSEYYDGDQHFGLGPNSYLFGDMMFFYLQRAITQGCWNCHQWDD